MYTGNLRITSSSKQCYVEIGETLTCSFMYDGDNQPAHFITVWKIHDVTIADIHWLVDGCSQVSWSNPFYFYSCSEPASPSTSITILRVPATEAGQGSTWSCAIYMIEYTNACDPPYC